MMPHHRAGQKDGTIELLLLAAGPSSRMGQSKQLLPVHGEPLLVRTVKTLLATGLSQPIVVLGAQETAHRKVLGNLPLQIVSNPQWQKGMGCSLKAGIQFIKEHRKSCQAVIVLVCDQPNLSSRHLQLMAEAHWKNPKAIIASEYQKISGVPVLFSRAHFEILSTISDGQGAKKLLEAHFNEIMTIPFPEGAIDLDTIEEYNKFNA